MGVKLGHIRVFGNKMLRIIFAPKWEGVTEDWRKLQIGELCDLYFSPLYGW